MQFEFNGETVYAGTGGAPLDSERESIVFVHGAGMDHTVWHVFARYFARSGFNAIAVDLPGHGRSGGTPLARIEDMSDWLAGALGAIGIGQAALVGHSMGSLVVFDCAARHGGLISRGVLLGFAHPMRVGAPLLDAARDNLPAAIDMMVIYGHDYRAQLGGNPVAGIHLINSARRLLARNRPGTLFADLSACNDYAGDAAIDGIQCPLLFASGDRDRMTSPRAAAAMAARVAAGEFRAIPDSGHGVMAEQPEAVHQLLKDALVLTPMAA